MLLLLLLLQLLHVAQLQRSEDLPRLVLRNGSSPCEGHPEVYYKSQWGLVGDTYWSRQTEEVICRSTHCGEPVEGSAQSVWRPPSSEVWLNELQCDGNQRKLWLCKNPGWGISKYTKTSVKRITCSKKIKISLEGSRCAGAVRYATDGVTASGYFCNDNWGEDEAKLVCEHLQCGGLKKIPRLGQMPARDFQSSEKMNLSCPGGVGKVDNLWQCAVPVSKPCQYPASVICSEHERLQLKRNKTSCYGQLEEEKGGTWELVNNSKTSPDDRCRQMHCGTAVNITQEKKSLRLKCTDRVRVVLMDQDKQSRCYGAVRVQINSSSSAVCGTTWTKKEAEVVCRELDCGTVNSFSTKKLSQSGVMDVVECLGNEASLWHCEAKHGNNMPCSSVAYVVCSGSLNATLVDGGGRCAGRLEVQHENKWKRVQAQGWRKDYSKVVCNYLQCGEPLDNPEEYSQGSGNFLTVQCSSGSQITKCTANEANNQAEQLAVGITCEKHMVVFLNGTCSGEVGIKRGSKVFWLSGSNATWNQESANVVCQQTHCGVATSNTSRPNMTTDIWPESLSCSSNEKSLLECNKTSPPPDHSDTVAYVTCSGTIELSLTDPCWGNVKVCADGTCGGVCANTWTEEKSKMLCKAQGCGEKVLKSNIQLRRTEVMFTSLHAMMPTEDLSQCHFIRKQSNGGACDPATVVCSGSVDARLSSSRDQCSGNVEMLYEDKWLPVCKDALNNNIRNVICRKLGCGGGATETLDYFGPTPALDQVITQLQCSTNNATSFEECDVTSERRSCDLGGLQCSEWRKVALQHDHTCRGEVVVHSAGKVSAVSSYGWSEAEGRTLCRDINCGSFSSFKDDANRTMGAHSLFNRRFNCTGKQPKSIWDCEEKASPPEEKRLFIECQNEINVTLSQKCRGELKINGIQVCANQWTSDYSNRVCQQLGCSNAIDVTTDKKPSPNGMYYHVSCDQHHHQLDQCRLVKGSCRNANLVSINCVGSIKFRTKKPCGGQIEVYYRGNWEKVCIKNELSADMKKQLCEEVGCTDYDPARKPVSKKRETLTTSLVCTEDHMDVKHCFKKEGCEQAAAEIYCVGFVPEIKETPDPTPIPTVQILVGVGFLLILVILVAVGVRYYLVRRNRKTYEARMLAGKEMEFESGEYEDVANEDNELEDFRGGRFRPEDEFAREDDRRSGPSLSYDDIDEAAEAQPLTSTADADAASRDGKEDGVTYEVEDPQESYDDIESVLEVTEAEVHDGPKVAANSGAAAPPAPAPGDEDYLVPGQDG